MDAGTATFDRTPHALILDAAQRLIVQNGYAGLSMRDLSRDSGLAKGTIYYYFQDKEAIYLSVVERDLISMRAEIHQAAQTPGSCIERLQAIVRAYFHIAQTNRSLFISRMREISGMEEPMRALLRTHRAALMRPIVELIEEGQAAGLFRAINAEMAIISLFGMMNSFVTHRFLIEQSDITEDVVEHTIELFLHGLTQ